MDTHFFVVLEGLDGAGKSEVSRQLLRILQTTFGENVLQTFEPNDTSAGGQWIRDALTHKIKTTNHGLALGYAFNRIDHNQRVITPFINGGDQRVVLCDRYYLSSLSYQSVDGLSMDDVMHMNREARTPDLTIFLDASTETCYQRMGKRTNKTPELFERNLAQTREKYQKSMAYLQGRGEKIITVNADADLISVINSVIDVMNAHAPTWFKVDNVTALIAAPKKKNPLLLAFASYDAFLPLLHQLSKRNGT